MTFVRMLKLGFLGLAVLVLLLLAAIGGGIAWAYAQIGSQPEVTSELTYFITDDQGQRREVTVDLENPEFSREDLEQLLEEGRFEGQVRIFAQPRGANILRVEMVFSLPVQEVLDEITGAAMGVTFGEVLGERLFGENLDKTLAELLGTDAVRDMEALLGPEYAAILDRVLGDERDRTLRQVFTEDFDQVVQEVLQEIPQEDLEQGVRQVLGDSADRTLDEILTTAPPEVLGVAEEMLGANYEEELRQVFGQDPNQTLGQVLTENPEKVLELMKRGFQHQLLRGLLEGQ